MEDKRINTVSQAPKLEKGVKISKLKKVLIAIAVVVAIGIIIIYLNQKFNFLIILPDQIGINATKGN